MQTYIYEKQHNVQWFFINGFMSLNIVIYCFMEKNIFN